MSESGSSKDELHLLQYIVKDVSRDIATQTSDTNSTEDENTTSQSTTGLFPKENVSNSALETRGLNNPNSSIRLFIVPDQNSVTECSASSGLKLSLQKPSDGREANSFCISIASSPDDYRLNTTASRRPKSSVKSQTPNTKEKKKGLRLEASRSLEKTENNFLTEHQLICSENPSVVAWLKLKNFEEKQKRRAKRREKRELRKITSDEAEKRKRRENESEMRFALWLRAKKSDAKRAWRENRAKRRVDAAEERQQIFPVSSEDIPPPNYTVVPSFKGTQALTEGLESLSIGELAEVRNNGSNEEHDVKEMTTLKGRGRMNGPQSSSFVQSGGCTPTPKRVHLEERPNTATGRMKSDSGNEDNKGPHGITYDAWVARKRKDKKVRPTTASGQLTNSGKQDNKGSNGITYNAWMAGKRRKNKQVRPSTASERLTGETDRDSEGSKRITYEAWMERKRHKDKEKAKQRKREVVDDALTAGILKVARKRVENIGEGKKVLDTGMPKWRVKNKVRSMSGDKTRDTPNPWREYVMRPDSEESKTSTNIQNTSEKNVEVQGGDSPKSGGVNTIRKYGHTIKSDSNDFESAGRLRESDYSVAKIINVPDTMSDNVRLEQLASDTVDENRTQIASSDEKFRIGRRCSDEKTIRDTELFKDVGIQRNGRDEKTTVRDNYFVYGEGLDPPSMTPAKWEPGDE